MALAHHQNRKRLGELLVDAGLLSKEQLDNALAAQKQTGERLGKVLVNQEYLTEEQLVAALECQLGIPRVELSRTMIGPDVVSLVPAQLARRYLVMPISCKDGRLRLAVAFPGTDSVWLGIGYNYAGFSDSLLGEPKEAGWFFRLRGLL